MGTYTTDMYEGMISETIAIDGHRGLKINAYFARPLGPGPYPGVVLIHHRPGWDEWYKETTRKFAYHGHLAICPNLYFSFGHGRPEEVTEKMRAAGGVHDDDVVADVSNAADYLRSLPTSNGKVAGFGTCSGGRHVFLVACRTKSLDAAIDCWGGSVVMKKEDLTPNAPVSPLDYAGDLSCPLLGLFGAEDRNPDQPMVVQVEAELKRLGKTYEFHSYPGAGHGFFYYHQAGYRQEQAVDGWSRIWTFLEKNVG
ncbi:MAG TPA: dienelactone hydrolase family protein [Nitrososphaerales archaeon]|nr:dienelactone hydrolase family protein [Nitrososphaerales archaeon]